MSCNCLKITLQTVPNNIPEHYKENNGTVKIDLYEDQTFLKAKKNEQLTEFDKLSGAAVLGIRVPHTNKNDLIFKGYEDATTYSFNHKAKIPVVIFENGLSLEQDIIIVIQEDKKGWELDIVKSDLFWKEALADYRLNDIDWGCFTFTTGAVDAMRLNPKIYNDGDAGYIWNVAHWKNWRQLAATYDANNNLLTQGEAGLEDTRPFLYVLAVLQKAFCAVGWKFRSPVLESDWGRHLLAYVLDDYSGGGDLTDYGFRASTVGTYLNTATGLSPATAIELHSEDTTTAPNYDLCGFHVVDPVGINVPLYAPLIFHYATGFSGILSVNFCVSISTPIATGLTFRVVARDSVVGCVLPACPFGLRTDEIGITTTPVTFCGTIDNFALIKPSDVITFTVEVSNPLATITIHDGSYWECVHTGVVITAGLFIPIQQIVKNYKFLDFFKGILHILGRGKIVTDYLKKEVWVFHDQEVQLFDVSEPEAFYKSPNFPIDINDKVICNSRVTKLNTRDLSRFYQLSFKDSTDVYIESLNFNNDTKPLWSRTVDFGEDFNNLNTTKSSNPFFEPTAQIEAADLKHTDAPFILPALWDDEEDRNLVAYDIAPRILYIHETLGYQLYDDDGAGTYLYRDMHYGVAITDDVPNMFQFSDQAIGIGAAAVIPTENIVYGTTLAESDANLVKDMYTLFWRQQLLELYTSITQIYDVLIDNCFYNTLDFRKFLTFHYLGQLLTVKLLQIRSFKPCLAKPAKFEVRPLVLVDQCLETPCIQCYILEDGDDIDWWDVGDTSTVKNIITNSTTHAATLPLSTQSASGIKSFIEGAIGGTVVISIILGVEPAADVSIQICTPDEVPISITICLANPTCDDVADERTYNFVPVTICS